MRGVVVPEELTSTLSFLRTATLVLVSIRNGPCINGAFDNESIPEGTSVTNHEGNPMPIMDLLDPEISLGADIEEASLYRDTLTSWFSPDVISTMTAQIAVPLGSKRTHSTAEAEPQVKKRCCATPHELPNSLTAALRCEEHQLEMFAALKGAATDSNDRHCNVIGSHQYPAQAEVADRAQQYDERGTLSARFAEVPAGEATSIYCDASPEGVLSQQVAPSLKPTRAVDESTLAYATAPALKLISVRVPSPYTDTEQQLDDKVNVNTSSGGNMQNMPFPVLEAASIDSIGCDAGTEGILSQQTASSVEPTHASYESTPTDATALALKFAPVLPPVLATELDERVREDILFACNVQGKPSQGDQSVPKRAQTFLEHPDALPLLPATLESFNTLPSEQTLRSSSRIMSRASTSDQTLRSSSRIMSRASTSDDVGLKLLISDRLQKNTSLSGRSQTARKEVKSAAYKAAQEVLRSPERAKMIRRWSMQGLRTKVNTYMTNAPYLSSSWLMERLVLHDKIPAYLVELQTAFECFGYDNVLIPDLFRRALDLAHTLKLLDRLDPRYSHFHHGSTYCIWAADIVRDAFFSGRSVRPDLKTYLRNKLKIHNVSELQLPNLPGYSPRRESNIKTLKTDLRMIKKVMNPKAVTNHPLDFTTFFNDVFHLVTTCHSPRKTVGGSGAIRNTKEPDTIKSQDDTIKKGNATTKKKQKRSRTSNPDVDLDKVTAIVTKYRKLFRIDLAAKVEALLKAEPDEDGPQLFNYAVQEGYISSTLLQNKLLGTPRLYRLKTHCSLGSITALYRQLFEKTNETNNPEFHETQGGSDSGGSDASEVVQEYLLKPYTDANQMSKSTLRAFDPLSAAFKILASWEQHPEPLPIAPLDNIPKDLTPLIRSPVHFGSPTWILNQLMHNGRQQEHPEHQGHRNELHFAFDLFGYQPVDIKQVFARAFVLAAAIIAKHEVPFSGAIERLKLSKLSRVYVLTADIIHASLFHTWPHSRDLAKYFATQLRYEVLPQHKQCLKEIMAKREEWYPRTMPRIRKGTKEVLTDWWTITTAKKSVMMSMDYHHPLSFDRFLKDVEVITKGISPAIPAIASKYKLLFGRDIVEDLRSIRAQSPQICYNESFVKGIEEGYVPYRYIKLLTVPRSETMMLNRNSLPLLGAHVDYFMSLVGPADAEVSREMCTLEDTTLAQKSDLTASLSSANEVDQKPQEPHPGPEERRAQLMAILRQAPPQKPPTGVIASTEVPELHSVARYLLGRS